MQFTLHRSFASTAALSGDWNQLLADAITNVPFLRYEYLSTWWSTLGGGEWPQSAELALVTAQREGHLVGIAPLFFSRNNEGEPSLLLLGSIEISDYLDLLVRPADLPEFVQGLLEYLAEAPFSWQTMDWYNLLETSPSLPVLQMEAGKRGWSCLVERTYHAPSIPLAGDFEQYLAGIDKKQRHEIRRKLRRAKETSGTDWYIVTDALSLEDEIEAFLALMASDPRKAIFLNPAMRSQMRSTIVEAFHAGWLQLAFLTINGVKAAVYLNFDYQGRIWVYNSGFDQRFTEYSPGWVLLGHLLQWANENQRTEFDFMRGDEEYKYRFGGVDKFIVRLKMERKK